MKKKLLSVLLCTALIGTLAAGCGSDKKTEDTKKEDTKKSDGKEITVMVPEWAVPSDDMLNAFTEESGINVVMNVVSSVSYTHLICIDLVYIDLVFFQKRGLTLSTSTPSSVQYSFSIS